MDVTDVSDKCPVTSVIQTTASANKSLTAVTFYIAFSWAINIYASAAAFIRFQTLEQYPNLPDWTFNR